VNILLVIPELKTTTITTERINSKMYEEKVIKVISLLSNNLNKENTNIEIPQTNQEIYSFLTQFLAKLNSSLNLIPNVIKEQIIINVQFRFSTK
jgi:flagellin-specific chaperone FliS